jgi:hypothetical protein
LDAKFSCSKCKKAHYCGKEHQKAHWKSHKLECGIENLIPVFPEYGLIVDEEHLEDGSLPTEEVPSGIVGKQMTPKILFNFLRRLFLTMLNSIVISLFIALSYYL